MDITYLVIENGLVTNAIVGGIDCPEGVTCVERTAGMAAWIGWSYDGTAFTAPPLPPAPPVLPSLEDRLLAALDRITELEHLMAPPAEPTP